MPDLRTWLAEADQQRDQATANNNQLRAEVERPNAEAVKASEAHQAELVQLADDHGKAAATKDAELKVAVEKGAGFEKELEARNRAWAVQENGMMCEAQHLDELLTRSSPKTQETAGKMVRLHRIAQEDAGVDFDRFATWSFTEIILAAEARLNEIDKQMKRLFSAGLGMTHALCPEAVAPTASRGWLVGWRPTCNDSMTFCGSRGHKLGAEVHHVLVPGHGPGPSACSGAILPTSPETPSKFLITAKAPTTNTSP
ncbi:uncharacterized protein [Aegilops tauschii subsp. strangulata]|uniref:uncharacterized protein n=1 Tax=Aegilops tauschii subsp. strangulata TaxID=200361 RepID=UPI001ABC1E05|nr:uncharacterized protein LOC120973667 [Aegilops tauschii subsp. strangulata]